MIDPDFMFDSRQLFSNLMRVHKDESSDFTVQDVLFIIGVQRRNGELLLEFGNNIGIVLLYQG